MHLLIIGLCVDNRQKKSIAKWKQNQFCHLRQHNSGNSQRGQNQILAELAKAKAKAKGKALKPGKVFTVGNSILSAPARGERAYPTVHIFRSSLEDDRFHGCVAVGKFKSIFPKSSRVGKIWKKKAIKRFEGALHHCHVCWSCLGWQTFSTFPYVKTFLCLFQCVEEEGLFSLQI